MVKLLFLVFALVLFSGCGVSTSSSDQYSDTNGTTTPVIDYNDDIIDNDVIYIIDPNPIDGGDTDIGDGIVYIDPNPVGDGCDCPDDNVTDGSDDGVTDGSDDTDNPSNPSDGESIFDKTDALEDEFACFIGNYSDGYTNNHIKDDNFDYLSESDLEDGVGILSRYPSTSDSEVILFYYDLKPERTLEVDTFLYGKFSIMIDRAWAQNDETVFYVRTPKNDEGLYGCYRVDAKTIDVDGKVDITKVYRLNK